MRLAIIDLGTNSVRFDVHQLGPKNRVRMLHREKIMVRLGQGVFTRGRLDRGATERTLHAFTRFARIAKEYRAQRIVAFGTSALREADDREGLLAAIEKHTGIHIRVISGSEEAQLIALGILSKEKTPAGKFALIDIGGGSTEISICQGTKILHSMSFPLGTARIQQVFLKKSPPEPAALEKARLSIRNTLLQTTATEHWPKVDKAIASSGTARALVRMLQTKSKPGRLSKSDLRKLAEKISTMTTTELLGISRMESKRVDMILAGAVLLDECMDVLGAKIAQKTEYSLRDGILKEEIRIHRKGSPAPLSLHLNDLIEKAVSLGQDRDHLIRTSELADALFDRLSSLHRLPRGWKPYLAAAGILRKTGEAISIHRHPIHSYYIVKNADLPAMEEWEIELVAELCLLHKSSKGRSEGGNPSFRKLLSILRVLDALDSGPDTRIALSSAKVSRGEVELRVKGRNLTGLEATNLALQGRLFETVFKRKLSLVSRSSRNSRKS